jgi:hypothetical protein
MRVLAIFLAVTASVPAIAAAPSYTPPTVTSPENAAKAVTELARQCPHTTSYVADQTGLYRGQRLTPKKLTELPPAIGYMAVYRHIGGCEAPMTMVEYRNPRRR